MPRTPLARAGAVSPCSPQVWHPSRSRWPPRQARPMSSGWEPTAASGGRPGRVAPGRTPFRWPRESWLAGRSRPPRGTALSTYSGADWPTRVSGRPGTAVPGSAPWTSAAVLARARGRLAKYAGLRPIGRRPAYFGRLLLGGLTGGVAPLDRGAQSLKPDPVRVSLGDAEQRIDQRVRQQVRLEAELDEPGVVHVVVVVVKLDAWVIQVLDLDRVRAAPGDGLGDLGDRHGLGHLVEDPELAPVGRILAGDLDTADGVPDVDDAAGLAAVAVNGQWLAQHGLDNEPVQHGAEHRVIVEPGGQPLVLGRLRGLLAVDNALIQVGGTQVPDPAGELDVVAVVHLGQVVEGTRALREQDPVLASLVLDIQPAFLDVDVGRAVLTHGAQLDQVDLRVGLGDRVQHVEVADHVVGLGVDRVLPVNHGVRRGALLGEVNPRVGPEVLHYVVGKRRVHQVADVGLDVFAGVLPPHRNAGLQGLDGNQAVNAELVVIPSTGEIVRHRDVVAARREVQRGRPPEIAVPAQHQDPHDLAPALSVCRLDCPRSSVVARTSRAMLGSGGSRTRWSASPVRHRRLRQRGLAAMRRSLSSSIVRFPYCIPDGTTLRSSE